MPDRRVRTWSILSVAALMLFPTLVVPALFVLTPAVTAMAVARSVTAGRRRSQERMDGTPEETLSGDDGLQSRTGLGQELRQQKAVEHDRRHGWNLSAFPFDMKADPNDMSKNTAVFSCAGIQGLVRGEARGNRVRYSFDVKDSSRASDIQRVAKTHSGAWVSYDRDRDTFVVSAQSAAVINALAKYAYPKKEMSVERTVTHSRYYVVRGAKDYDDALKRFKLDRDSAKVAHSEVSVRDRVDGSVHVVSDGNRFRPESLPVGTFVIREDDVYVSRGKAFVSGDVIESGDRERILAAASRSFQENGIGVTTETRVSALSDGTPVGVDRTFDDGLGNDIVIRGMESPLGREMKTYLVCENMDAFAEILNEGKIPEGTLLVAERKLPAVEDGKFILELDPDQDIRALLGVQGEASPAFVAKCGSMGISKEQLETSLLLDEVAREGYASVRLKGEVGLDRVKVNGVPVAELADRMSNGRLESLDREGVKKWINDASKIQAINITVDAKRAELRITSVVNDVHKVETRKMTDKEIADFSRRGTIGKAEMKDLLMQVHPDFFKSYSDRGRSMFLDPLKDFLSGRKPTPILDALRRTPEAVLKTANGLRI